MAVSIKRMMTVTDEWSGLAELLANLIEKYACDLELDTLPDPIFISEVQSVIEKAKIE